MSTAADVERMPDGVVSREPEDRAVTDFLTSACAQPSALVIAGEPGIGKTTSWLAAVASARQRGFRVLSARAAAAESVLAYGALADLLAGLDAIASADLPHPQRLAVDRILLRASADGAAVDQHAISAGFLSAVERLGEESPVLVAIDDLQWLDPSSAQVIAFAARRLTAPVGVLVTVRGDADSAASWLQLPNPDSVARITLRPLAIGALYALISERLGRTFSRPTMLRIHEVSGGNPFYAIELARGIDAGPRDVDPLLPRSLAELVRARLGSLTADARDALLAVACLADPTVSLVSRAVGTDADRMVDILAEAEEKAIIGIDGNRLRFTHPLLATGVYTDAAPAQRRMMHRRLGEIVDQPELRARHLALSATSADPLTLAALDTAADSARTRGAPAAAAELFDLALRLGDDTPERQMGSAAYHFDAGDTGRAGALLGEAIERLAPGMLRAQALCQLALVRVFDQNFVEAADLLRRALGEAEDNLTMQVQALVALSWALVNSGHLGTAVDTIEDAVLRAECLGQHDLLSQALGLRVLMHFMRGDVIDEPSLRRALEMEGRHTSIPLPFRPSMQNAMMLGWTGQLDSAHDEMLSIRRRCLEHGDESGLLYVAFHAVLIAIWRGDLIEAMLVAEDAVERATQLGGDVSLSIAMTIRAAATAYGGREDDARRDLAEALAASQRCGSYRLAEWPITILGFLEVSLGNYQEALTALEPLLSHLDAAPEATEIVAASFVPDIVEAMIQLGRLGEAEPLIGTLERNGCRLDRAWMLAVGARCRSMLLAAQGDLDAAVDAVERAMVEHKRLLMPFERARTQLLLGQLQRRQRQKSSATASLGEALQTFEGLQTTLWADRVRGELVRTNVGPSGRTAQQLTPAEQRVAELAASGMTNREIATALFISPKTVDVNLYRVYRKLDIQSRSQLARRLVHRTEP
ncbi:ATP-binding protein [Mycobacterium sp. RTGN4]|uniref:ATP-binding protein n=2 Tax=unclassified Mycobacterium TaxID=2642494 RepID=UPI0029C72800|nr:AAA family ATPase [Mycobacterium sp. RTGN4]